MYASTFVFNIVEEILGTGLTSKDYKKIEGVECGRNVFYYCIRRNHKYLDANRAFALKYVILRKIKNSNSLKIKLYEYFKSISKELKNYIETNPENMEQIIDLTISKFTNPDYKIAKQKNIDIQLKEIAELYVKIALYLNKDIETACILLSQMISKLLNYIIKENKIKFINKNDKLQKLLCNSSINDILPNDIESYFLYLSTIKSNNVNSSKDFSKMIFLSLKYICKWFFKDFLKEPEYYTKIYCRAYENFKKDEFFNEIQIYTFDELKEKNWTLEKFAKSMLKIFYETIGEDFENVTGVEELMKNVNHQRDTHRVMLNNKEEIIGCWAFGAIKDELFEKDKKGNLLVEEITPLTMPTMIPGKTYNLHFGAICLKDSYRKTYVFSKLFHSIMNEIEKLAINNIFINEIATKACSDSGINLAESIGLKYCCDHVSKDGKIYSEKIINLLDSFYLKDFTILKEKYKDIL